MEVNESVAAVREYYNRYGEREWERLERPDDGAVEGELHARAFAEFLPPAPARVLDVGGGPGRWSLWLAERGYRVTLADLSPQLLHVARERIAAAPKAIATNIEAVIEADARDLTIFPDAAFDAVLSLGPFYHLQRPEDRDRAAVEARRVLRPGGVFCATVMVRPFWILAVALERQRTGPFPEIVRAILEDGVYNDTRPGRFTGAYLFRPQDVEPFFAAHGFEKRHLMSSQGMLGTVQAEVAALAEREPETYRELLDIAYRTADDSSFFGLAAHLLFIGKRSAE